MRPARAAAMTAGALTALIAVPASADASARAAQPQRVPASSCCPALPQEPAILRLAVVVRGCTVCAGLDVADVLKVRVRIGPGDCAERPAPPPAPVPPPVPPPVPAPPPAKPPGVVAPPAGPRPSARPPVRVPVRPRPVTARNAARPAPAASASRPPSSPAPVYRAHVLRANTLPHRRKNPLATLVVLVVLSSVIAAGAGVAFGGAR